MAVVTTKYVRNPLFVDAVQVTAENFTEIALWCSGTIRNKEGESVDDRPVDPRKDHIWLDAHNPKNDRQSKAYVGDWVLYTDRGFKIYTKRAFENSFKVVVPEPTAHIGKPHPSDPAATMVGNLQDTTEVEPMGIEGMDTLKGNHPQPQIEPATPEGIADAVRENAKSLEQAGEQAEAEKEAAKPPEQKVDPEIPGDQPTEGSWGGEEQIES